MMQALKLDYQAENRRTWIGKVVLVLGLLSAVLIVWNLQQDAATLSFMEARLDDLSRNGASVRQIKPVDGKDAQQISQELNQANVTILELGLPWRELFEAFESSKITDVAVLAIEPDPQKGTVRIGAEAKSLNSMLNYLAYLQKVPFFNEVSLLNHQIQDLDPQKPVRFMMQASWNIKR